MIQIKPSGRERQLWSAVEALAGAEEIRSAVIDRNLASQDDRHGNRSRLLSDLKKGERASKKASKVLIHINRFVGSPRTIRLELAGALGFQALEMRDRHV